MTTEETPLQITIDTAAIKQWAVDNYNKLPMDVMHVLLNVGDMYAGMEEETRSIIVNPDTNGGKYQTKTQHRYVTEWADK